MTRRSHELELENLRLRIENAELRSIHARDMEALKESSTLLLKSKPSRPHISAEKKLLIAGEQRFRCAGDRTRCPCWNEGSFDESGFEIDHSPAWCDAYRSDRAVLQALCVTPSRLDWSASVTRRRRVRRRLRRHDHAACPA